MNELVQLSRQGEIAVITINNPPVNALSPGVPEGIVSALDVITADSAIAAVVVIGSGTTFIAGADIKEFQKMVSGERKAENELLPLLQKIEDCPKPVVMAIHGMALGGGLELAMAGHYRVAVPDAQVGQPEVKLGLIPGAGGTQRLPRLAGVMKAVEMCAAGESIRAPEALQVGILDRLVEGPLLEGAIAFAREIAGARPPKTRERDGKLGSRSQNFPVFSAAREQARQKARGIIAPLAAIDAIEAATKLPFEQGLETEQKLFFQCLFSEQSRALIHIFFAEREVAKIPDIPRTITPRPIQKVAIVGAGTMGSGIAMVFANADIAVTLKDSEPAALNRALETIRKNYETSAKRGRITQEMVEKRLSLIEPTLEYGRFSDADLVIEAVFEEIELKKKVFRQLDGACNAGAIIATNTSGLDLDEIASVTSRPESIIGMHFFSPANVMRLLEIVRGRVTKPEVVAACMQLAKKLKKIGVLVGNCRGFVGNRMFLPYLREAEFLVEEGAGVQEVDDALYEFGMAMGPLATADLAGLDVGYRVRKARAELEKPELRQPILSERLYKMGHYGQKTGAGWYRYDEARQRAMDAEMAKQFRYWSLDAGIHQRQISRDEIVERCIYSLVNEGARALEEGCALRSGDIDIVYAYGYGFPAYRGGPMWYADRVGLNNVYERVCDFRRRFGEFWEPAPLLRRLAEENSTFAECTERQLNRR